MNLMDVSQFHLTSIGTALPTLPIAAIMPLPQVGIVKSLVMS